MKCFISHVQRLKHEDIVSTSFVYREITITFVKGDNF